MKKIIPAGTIWAEKMAYSRVVMVNNTAEVAGTVAVDAGGQLVGLGDAYAQSFFILQKIGAALQEAGFSLSDVVRTRIYLTNVADWQAVGRAHGEFFANITPVTTLLGVAALIAPEFLVEIEATAIKVL